MTDEELVASYEMWQKMIPHHNCRELRQAFHFEMTSRGYSVSSDRRGGVDYAKEGVCYNLSL